MVMRVRIYGLHHGIRKSWRRVYPAFRRWQRHVPRQIRCKQKTVHVRVALLEFPCNGLNQKYRLDGRTPRTLPKVISTLSAKLGRVAVRVSLSRRWSRRRALVGRGRGVLAHGPQPSTDRPARIILQAPNVIPPFRTCPELHHRPFVAPCGRLASYEISALRHLRNCPSGLR